VPPSKSCVRFLASARKRQKPSSTCAKGGPSRARRSSCRSAESERRRSRSSVPILRSDLSRGETRKREAVREHHRRGDLCRVAEESEAHSIGRPWVETEGGEKQGVETEGGETEGGEVPEGARVAKRLGSGRRSKVWTARLTETSGRLCHGRDAYRAVEARAMR
jgi:hypothetical protein